MKLWPRRRRETAWTVDVDVALHYPPGPHRTHRATVLAANAAEAECAAAQLVACRRDDDNPLHRIAMPVATRIVDWPPGERTCTSADVHERARHRPDPAR